MPRPKPKVLSLAPTSRCEFNCPCCYLHRPDRRLARERHVDFFCAVLREASLIGFEEAAMSVNRFSNVADKNYIFLKVLKKVALDLDLRFTVTTNYENVERFGAQIYENCYLVSLSYDEFKFKDQSRLTDLLSAAQVLRDYVPTVNINVLLTRRLMNELLTQGLLDTLLRRVDSIYLLLPKGYPADFTQHEFLEFVDWLLPLLNDFDVFRRVSVDNCIKPFVHPFSSVYPNCERGHHIVAVGPGGEVAYSVYDRPFAVLQRPEEFQKVFEEMFVKPSTSVSPIARDRFLCQKSRSCPLIEFGVPPLAEVVRPEPLTFSYVKASPCP